MGSQEKEVDDEYAQRVNAHVNRAQEIAEVLVGGELSRDTTRNVLSAVLGELLEALRLAREWRAESHAAQPAELPAPRRPLH